MIPKLKTILFVATLFSPSFLLALNIDSTGFAGDHFSLEGALGLFEKAESLEDFEKELNTENNYVNNLDLNEDGEIDYIRVIDHQEDDVHAIVLQVPLNEKESQDIAVIEIEKTSANSAMLQIIGDEDVYGEQKIVEPYELEEKETGNGPMINLETYRIIVNVWAWPSVRFVYAPGYRPYVSPFGWRVYPRYWRPWRPHPWRFYHTNRVFRPRCQVVRTHRVVRARQVYTPVRRTTTVVRTRTTLVRNQNGKVVGTRTKTTKTVRGNNGNVKAQKSTTKTVRKTSKGKVATKKKTTKVRKSNKRGTAAGKKTSRTTKRKRH